jgi:hypothetical protein
LMLCVLCLLAFNNLGGSIYGLLAKFQGSLANSAKGNTAGKGQTASASLGLADQPVLVVTNVGQFGSTTSGASQALLVSPQTVKNTISVVGANGATNQLASALEAQAKSLLAAGEIDATQANLIITLANNGHYLASAQKAYEDAVSAEQKQVTFENKTYNLNEFGSMLGFTNSSNSHQNWEIPPDLAGKFLAPFATTYQQVKQSSLSANAAVNQQLRGLIMQIGANADALGWAADDLQTGEITAAQMNVQAAQHFVVNMDGTPPAVPISSVASDRTTQNSSQLCNTGGGEDHNEQCSGI